MYHSIGEANAWLDTFIDDFNRRFTRLPRNPKNLHRPVTEKHKELEDIFAWLFPPKRTLGLLANTS